MTSKTIHIFGHSLGESDHSQFVDYFRDFSGDKNSQAELILYHYGMSGYYSLLKEIDRLTGNQLTRFRATRKITWVNTEENSLDFKSREVW